jgi:hypothetical protein
MTHRIWIGGDHADATRACRSYTLQGLCVAIQPVDYVYTMGMESGVCVTLINYPRIPFEPERIEAIAIDLGHFLCKELHQGSFSVEGPKTTHWFSRRAQDQPVSG